MPNPGPGGAAYYSPDFVIPSKIFLIDHDTTINYCELYSIKMVLDSILRCIQFCEQQKSHVCFDYINIYTDSKFVCDVLGSVVI